ncbi:MULTISPECIES: 50S ribosomal protein L29 [Holospora]|uniref:Large ribosomal subunit protein uL29 n=2 Tax=Holospora TaxID=44747 RepID=A0A061JG09_9PROT|nr:MULTISPECIES: 50S ribosomal protein L29 [Holospora]ETZ04761.1 50S ribosomal protein L29 [Holospora undulata HU1]GAJ46025.1 50S ribosomal protein L29 [Holospora elegans E1]
MKSTEYLNSLVKMSDRELFDELLGLLRQRAAFSFTKGNPQTKALSHRVQLVRRNIARLKMVMAQRKKEK